MVVAQFDGLSNNLVHYERDNNADGYLWHRNNKPIYSALPPARRPTVVDVSLVQSNFAYGNLEVVARMHPVEGPLPNREGDHLSFFYYDSNTENWNSSGDIIADGKPINGVTGF